MKDDQLRLKNVIPHPPHIILQEKLLSVNIKFITKKSVKIKYLTSNCDFGALEVVTWSAHRVIIMFFCAKFQLISFFLTMQKCSPLDGILPLGYRIVCKVHLCTMCDNNEYLHQVLCKF